MTTLRFFKTLPLPSRIVEVFSTTGWAATQVAHRSKHRFTFRLMFVSATEPSYYVRGPHRVHLADPMNGRILLWSITSALAGFLFGFDTVVISGAEQSIQAQWGLGAGIHGIVMASALYGTVLGSLVGGWPTDRYGRKPTLLFIGILYIVGAVGSAIANGPIVFIAARVMGGLGIGISTVAAPLYISEIAPPQYRGRLAGLFQFNIVFGIVVAYVSNAWLADLGPNAWRWMLGVAAIPSILYTLLCFGLPESPRWLLAKKGDRAAGLSVLKLIEPRASDEKIQAEAQAIL